MRIADEFLQCVVYVYPSEDAAREGKKVGGSGFLVHSLCSDGAETRDEIFVVTNRHVIASMKDPVLRVNRRDGAIDVIKTNGNRWRSHPDGDDVSALPFHALSEEHQLLAINEGAFLRHSTVDDFNVGIGDSVAMVGRLVGHDGKMRNSPTARFGSISMMPGDRILNSFGYEQESYLIECHSIPGFSGSPVLLVLPSNVRSAGGLLLPGLGPWLLGIDWMHINNEEAVRNCWRNTHLEDRGVVEYLEDAVRKSAGCCGMRSIETIKQRDSAVYACAI